MSHFTKECEYGKSHGTCRCPSEDKEIIKVPCDRPDKHRPAVVTPDWSEIIDDFLDLKDGKPKTLRDRMEETVDAFFGAIVMPVVKESLLDKLEQNVKDWLLSEVHKIIKE